MSPSSDPTRRIYFACFTEPASPDSAELMKRHFSEHKQWVREHEHDLFLAGPLLDESLTPSGSGLLLIRADSAAAASELAAADPMHRSGARTFRIVAWQINEGHVTTMLTMSSGAFDVR